MDEMVRFEIGPVSMRAARRWLTHARASVDGFRASGQPGIPTPVLDEFEALIDQWSGSVDRGELFHWQSVVPVERLRRLATFWAVAARAVRSPETELSGPPAEARPFYEALVAGVTSAIAAADEGGLVPTLQSVLPRFDERPRPLAVRGPAAPVAPPPAAKRVLVVEDTQDVRLLLRLGLRTYPELEIVGEAGDGLEALAVATDVRPDVVLLDIALPRMSGLEALPHLRALLPHGRIVAYSASSERRAGALAAGADAFVLKGAALDELAEALLGREVSEA